MLKFVAAALIAMNAGQTSAEEIDLTVLPSSELVAEMEYLSARSKKVEVDQTMNGVIEKVYSAISLCKGVDLEELSSEVENMIFVFGVVTGGSLKPNLNRIHPSLAGKTGCGLAKNEETILSIKLRLVQHQEQVKSAIDVREEILNDRLLRDTYRSDAARESYIALRAHASE